MKSRGLAKTKHGLLLELGKWDRVPYSGDSALRARLGYTPVATEARGHVSSIPDGGSGLDRHHSSHVEADVQRGPASVSAQPLEPGPVIARLQQDNRQVPDNQRHEELLPKCTEHHRLQTFS